MFLSHEGPTLERLDFLNAFYISSTPTFLYFDLYLNTAYAALRLFHFRSVPGLVLVILFTSEPMLITATIALILIILILVYF